MATSRSRGPSSLARLPLMRNSPLEMSSSPAIIRSVVDFPQPDGPTKTMNSPLSISKLKLCTA